MKNAESRVRRPLTATPLLSGMARDFEQRGALRASTATAMWAAYTVHATATMVALRRPARSRRGTTIAGATVAAVGTMLCLAGMGRFGGAQQLTGTRSQPLVSSGVYSVSRNPQYAGYVLALLGAAVARRSPAALALTGVAAGAYRAWLPLEEAHLRRTIGAPYAAYAARTPRWLGIPGSPRRRAQAAVPGRSSTLVQPSSRLSNRS